MVVPVTRWRIERWVPSELRAHAAQVLEVYRAAFLEHHELDPVRATADRGVSLLDALTRPALRAVGAVESVPGGRNGQEETVIGFGYGYTSQPGQWWHDVVHRALATTGQQGWLDNCFAVVELHVLPERQGLGIGRTLLTALLEGLPHAAVALSAIDDPRSRAMRLYAEEGFRPLISGFRFPGNLPAYAVLARNAPGPGTRMVGVLDPP